MNKTALITGITGQDGSFLAEFLLDKGYDVHGTIRRSSVDYRERIAHLEGLPHFHLHYADLGDSMSILQVVKIVQPDEIYNLAAQSHVQVSFDSPEFTANVDATGVLRVLEAVRHCDLIDKCRIYQASTSELYGKVEEVPQNENTPFHPYSPYAVAKQYVFWIVKEYREAYNMFCCSGILFNHESERRGETFVTRKITLAAARIAQGKQEKLFHEVIFQIGNREDMAVGTEAGDLAVNVLDEYVKDFQKRNPTLRVFSCYLHQDEATPHLHIDFVPYVTNWKGKGMDTRVSLKQALKSLGFQGGNKHDTELNQWINHEKEVLAEIAKQHGIEWEQKGTHEEHLDVYNFKKKERKKEVQELEQEKEYLTAENEGLTSQIADARADIKLLEEEKIQFQKDKETAEKRAGKAEMELKKLEDRREFLQPVMDNVSKEIKEYGMIKTFLPEATTLERAVTYRDKKIKPLFIEMKNKIGAMAVQVKELTRERDSWKSKFQKKKQEHEKTKKELAEVQKDYQKLSGEKEILQELADRYNRLLRMLGKDMVERLVQDDIRIQAELEAKKQKEQMPKKISDRIPWAKERSEEHNAQIKKNKAKYRGMEL